MDKKLIILFFMLLSCTFVQPVFADKSDEATVYYNDAIDKYSQDDIDKSIELFQKALELNPDFYEAHYNLAQILMSLNRNEEALKSLEKIIKLKPNDSETLYSLGRIQYKRGYLSSAHKYLKAIETSAPQYESAKLLIEKIEKRQAELNLEAKLRDHKNVINSQGKAESVELIEIPAPSGIITDSKGNIYGASFSENIVYKISTTGQKSVFTKSNLLRGPIGLAIDKDDNIYIANYSANNIIKVTPKGHITTFADVKKPYCITFDTNNNRLYATEQNTNKVLKFDL